VPADGLEDAANYGAVGEHVEVVIATLAGRAGGGRAFKQQAHSWRRACSTLRFLWRQLVYKFGPQVFDQLAHRIGDGLDALELEDFLAYPLNFVRHDDPAVEDAELIAAPFLVIAWACV
jgi:hypothetical protein